MRVLASVLSLVAGIIMGLPQAAAQPKQIHQHYFMKAAPAEFDRAQLPTSSRDFIVAKVRFHDRLVQIGKLDRPIARPQEPEPKDLFFARVDVVAVVESSGAPLLQYDVYFGMRDLGLTQLMYLLDPKTRKGDFFIVAYLDEDDKWRLLPFPVDEREYQEFERKYLTPIRR